jgi:hypothetical protein
MADISLFIAACRHITTLSLSRYTVQIIEFVTHKPDEQSRKNKLYFIATTSLLAVGTNNLI